jgi:hypothetical protein
MSDFLFYAVILLIGILVGIFVSPKGLRGGLGGCCPHCGRYH